MKHVDLSKYTYRQRSIHGTSADLWMYAQRLRDQADNNNKAMKWEENWSWIDVK